VKLIQTAIRGQQTNPGKFHLADFDLSEDDTPKAGCEQGQPTGLTCPQGQTVALTSTRTGAWQARFDQGVCATCPFQQAGRCPTQPQKRDPRYLLAFTPKQVVSAKRRKQYLAHKGDGHNLRSAVEATMRSLKHPFPAGKFPVRGRFRVTCMAIASAATTNVRRIQRYLAAKMKAERTENMKDNRQNPTDFAAPLSFWRSFSTFLISSLNPYSGFRPISVC
jgi:hypothetical protein